MIELPEAITLGKQFQKTLVGKVVTDVYNATNLHKFAFFNGDPQRYKELLVGKVVQSAEGYGIFVDIRFNDETTLSLFDGINTKYGDTSSKVPDKYQLLLTFNDNTYLAFTVSMYGGMYAYKGEFDNVYYRLSKESLSPLSDEFNQAYFDSKLAQEKKNISAKAFLATEQRIPGIGNGVTQDILFNAGIHPKRKIFTFTDADRSALFHSLKETLQDMTSLGGRETETDLYGNKGCYQTILSKNTYKLPCPKCGGSISKEAYLGGSIYYCRHCQKLE